MDYKETLLLPKTDFSMRADLAKKEPRILQEWKESALHDKMSLKNKGKDIFTVHDGPPYANGSLHIGHALNKVIKDIINRFKRHCGYSIHYVPGWDCHGLPIEWKVEEQIREQGQSKEDVSILEFRQKCRDFASKWVNIQSEQFQRLGVDGTFDAPYLTMTYDNEMRITQEILSCVKKGLVYRGLKPVLWSPVERTALAEAEVEYQDHKSTTLYVKFPVKEAEDQSLIGAFAVIWTTTPWTIPCNQALGYHKDISYGVFEVSSLGEESLAQVGERYIVAQDLAEGFFSKIKVSSYQKIKDVTDLSSACCSHPLVARGYTHDIPFLHGDFVTLEQGTGIVHIAPAHGLDDFQLCKENGIQALDYVDEASCYRSFVPVFAGGQVIKDDGSVGSANGLVIKTLLEEGMMLSKENIKHSYPMSWRSKAPLIYRCTAQWFIRIGDENGLRGTALKELEKVKFYPERSRSRLTSMIQDRPDWCISRQRFWGVPIALFVHKETGEILQDDAVFQRILDAFAQEGADAWFSKDADFFLQGNYVVEDYDQVFDIVDVWFESGCTHAFVLEQNKDKMNVPADLYFEGSDQHRGWFQSSLLESCATRGVSPFKALLTHGFVMDAKGRKMSKSLGNTITPEDVISKYGADILRLWCASCQYQDDMRIGDDILKGQSDLYRRIRNTFRWILGNVKKQDVQEVAYDALPDLEKYICHRLYVLNGRIKEAYDQYDFARVVRLIHDFCALDCSALYFDIRKDSMYCDEKSHDKRIASVYVLDKVIRTLAVWCAPILCFTAEEAYQAYEETTEKSVHLLDYPHLDDIFFNEESFQKWQSMIEVRRVVLSCLEKLRNDKVIGSSLEAGIDVYLSKERYDLLSSFFEADLFITSRAHIHVKESGAQEDEEAFSLPDVADVLVKASLAEGGKCERCWKVDPEVKEDQSICPRCSRVCS